jgi:hypothetical protein
MEFALLSASLRLTGIWLAKNHSEDRRNFRSKKQNRYMPEEEKVSYLRKLGWVLAKHHIVHCVIR